MQTTFYDTLRSFADSWGLVYMFGIFLIVAAFVLRPGAKANAQAAAWIPLEENEPNQGNDRS